MDKKLNIYILIYITISCNSNVALTCPAESRTHQCHSANISPASEISIWETVYSWLMPSLVPISFSVLEFPFL